MRTEGTTAPEFELPGVSADGHEGSTKYRLSSLLDDGPVLLNFYLFDFHPACTDTLCDLHDVEWLGLETDLTILGISTDRTFSHQAFAEEEGLGFPLLSDSDGSVAESYGVLYEEYEGHKRIAKRSLFVVGTDRTIRYAWVADDPAQGPDWDEVRSVVNTLD